MRITATLLCLLGAYALATAQNSTDTTAGRIAATAAADFVYNPIKANKLMMSAGGVSTPRQIAQWPALKGMGVAQTSFVMNGCALRPPHTHMQATGLLYAISAANLTVGFVTESGQSVINTIQTGASAIFPQGLIHYQQNNDCMPAYYTISYNSEEPGTQVTIPAFEALPASVVTASLGMAYDSYSNLLASKPTAAFIPRSDPACVARCQASGINVLAPAPATMPAVSAAGR